jgi:hypothetical protein
MVVDFVAQSLPANFPSLFDQNMVSPQLIDCIMGLLRYEPKARYTAKDCLEHPYFRDVAPRYVPLPEGAIQQVLPPTPTSAHGMPLPQQIPQQIIPLASPPPTGPEQPPRWLRQPSMASMQSMPESINSDYQPQPWERPYPGLRKQTGTSSVDFYDGSIFEGIAPSRDLSLYNHEANSPTLVGSTTTFGGSTTSVYDDDYSRSRQAEAQQAQHANGNKSKGWSVSSMFGSQQPQQAASSTSSLKRTTSQRSTHEVPPAPAGPADSKKAKKEAEKAAKEAERARREAAALAARERARAVMQKKSQLGQKADAYRMQPNNVTDELAKNKLRSPAQSHLPKIAEDPSRLVPFDPRWKARRRDDDDDVHSVSSNETRNSAERRYSVSSYATVDSDPGPRAHLHQNGNLSRMTTGSSVSSTGSLQRFHMAGHDHRPPSTSGSSVDFHLAQNFQGLSAADGAPVWPYSSPGPNSEKSFTFNPAVHSLAAWQAEKQARAQSPSASFHSLPPSLPSHHSQLSTQFQAEQPSQATDMDST